MWRVDWLCERQHFPALAEPWETLAAGAPPFAQYGWFVAWWEAFGDQGATVCTVWDSDGLAALLPLMRQRFGLRAPANAETPTFRPLARSPEALSRLATSVVEAAPRVELQALPLDDPSAEAVRAAATRARRLAVIDQDFESPYVQTSGSFSAYRDLMKHRWSEIERRGRKLAREHDVELELIHAPSALGPELEEGLALEASGWKGEKGTAILASPATAAFYRAVLQDAHLRGEARFSSLRVDGRLVAWDMAIVSGGRYHLLKTAYDQAFRKAGPGLILRRAVVERCFETGLETHEFLGHDLPWKRLFATGSRRHVVLRLYARRGWPVANYVYRRSIRPPLRTVAKTALARVGPGA